jgi:RNA polymerase sigma factor for flagellar operon FliA
LTGAPSPLLDEALALVREIAGGLGRRHHASRDEVEEIVSRAHLKLVDPDGAVLRGFAGESSLRTYLATVVHRLLLDLRRSRWGKWRPSAAARRLGPVGVRLEELLLRDGRSFDEACGELCTPPDPPGREDLARMAALLPARPGRRTEGEDALVSLPAPTGDPEESALAAEAQAGARTVEAALFRALARLPPQDQLVIRLHFLDGFTVAGVARALGLDQKALYRRIEQLLGELRREMQAEGLGTLDVGLVLDRAEWDFAGRLGGWLGDRKTPGPSV